MLTKTGKMPTWYLAVLLEISPCQQSYWGQECAQSCPLHLQTPLPKGPCVFLQPEEGYGCPNFTTCLLATVYLLLALGEEGTASLSKPRSSYAWNRARPELDDHAFRNGRYSFSVWWLQVLWAKGSLRQRNLERQSHSPLTSPSSQSSRLNPCPESHHQNVMWLIILVSYRDKIYLSFRDKI